ncbi:hypothetical protein EYF80_011143 [Liparis tanakae]|uniref:Uncharacterized protein n=1 Tax=Liparis tanakae TaxID=230148 RepID=A0A4Z2ILE5_9TELE|nr:hypothetical protein EYF80_011143 [Liparis tanakae]
MEIIRDKLDPRVGRRREDADKTASPLVLRNTSRSLQGNALHVGHGYALAGDPTETEDRDGLSRDDRADGPSQKPAGNSSIGCSRMTRQDVAARAALLNPVRVRGDGNVGTASRFTRPWSSHPPTHPPTPAAMHQEHTTCSANTV